MTSSIRLRSTAVMSLLAFALGGTLASAQSSCPGETPEATFAQASEFLAAGDMGLLASCFTPEDRKKGVKDLLDGAAIMAALSEDEATMAGFAELLAKHELPDPLPEEGEVDAAAIAAAIDEADLDVLIEDLVAILDAASEGGSQGMDVGELTGLVVEGDTARGEAGGQSFVFHRVDGLWYLAPPGA